MEMAQQKTPDAQPKQAEPEVPTWPKSEHILHADEMYGRPAWLVESVLLDIPAADSITKEVVNDRINAYLNHPTSTEG
jgi:hypothetical protein